MHLVFFPFFFTFSDLSRFFQIILLVNIKDLDLPNEKTNFLKAKIKDCAL